VLASAGAGLVDHIGVRMSQLLHQELDMKLGGRQIDVFDDRRAHALSALRKEIERLSRRRRFALGMAGGAAATALSASSRRSGKPDQDAPDLDAARHAACQEVSISGPSWSSVVSNG